MNKSFIKSITAAAAGLTLVASCSHLGMGKDSHKCASSKCSGKKMEDSHKCGAANGCAAKTEKKTVTTKKTTEVKN